MFTVILDARAIMFTVILDARAIMFSCFRC